MSRLAVLVGERRDQVDLRLLETLLCRWAERGAIDVDVVSVRQSEVAASYAAAAEKADGVLIDAGLIVDFPNPSSTRTVRVEVRNGPPSVGPTRVRTIYGRGIDTYVWAARHLAAWLRLPASVIAYGDHSDQVGELRVPDGAGQQAVVVLIHGGFWHHYWERDLMDDLAVDLTEAGLATWNIEYRRGPGSWSLATADVAGAIEHLRVLADEHRLTMDRVALVGHSAGGHLAMWAAGRPRHGPDADAALSPALVVPLAPISDLVECAARDLGQGAVLEFLAATPEAEPDRYRSLDPLQRLPVAVPMTIVQGMNDGPDLIDLNRRYATRAGEANDPTELLELDDTDHFDVIDARSDAWARIRGLLVDGLAVDPDR